jgi:hypothetical protein
MTTPTFDGTGLRVRTLEETRQNMRENIRNSPDLGPQIQTGPYSVSGMIIDSAATGISETDDLLSNVYQGWDPDSADGVQMDNLATFTGITRQAATRSYGQLTLGGTPTTPIPALSRARIPNGEEVRTKVDAVIGGGGTVVVDAEAVNPGPLSFAASSITEIVTGISGWTSVTNAFDWTEGTARETDSELRARRARSLSAGGSSTDSAIRARLEDLDDVQAAAVISNRTLVTDIYGVPGKSCWIIIDPSSVDPDIVAATIWGPAGFPSGIAPWGSQQGTITDERGYAQVVKWDWATEVRLWITATLTKGAQYPAGGDDLVKQSIVNWGQSSLNLAGVVEPQPIDTWVGNFTNAPITGVPGIAKLVITLSRTGVPGGGDTDPIPMAPNERGKIDLADVLVVAT